MFSARFEGVPQASMFCNVKATLFIQYSEKVVCNSIEEPKIPGVNLNFGDRCRLRCLEKLHLPTFKVLGECPIKPLHDIWGKTQVKSD